MFTINRISAQDVINDYVLENDPVEIMRSHREDILDFQYDYLWRLYNYTRETNSGTLTIKLSNMVLINPEINMEKLKVIVDYCDSVKLVDEENAISFVRYGGKYYDQIVEAYTVYLMEVAKKNYIQAIEKSKKYVELETIRAEYEKKNDPDCIVCLELKNDHIFQVNCEINIMKAILARKSGKIAELDPEIIEYYWKHPDLCKFNKYEFGRFLTVLIVFNKTNEFEKVFDNYPLESMQFFFRCRERAEVYFEWFYQHEYWLTPEFKKTIEKVRPKMLAKIKDCGIAEKKKIPENK